LATAAAIVAAFVFIGGLALSTVLPEPKGDKLPD